MKTILACLFLSSFAVSLAEETARFIFPPFAKDDVAAALTRPIPEYFPDDGPLPEKEPIVVTVEELRRIMTIGEYPAQSMAVRELLEREDQKTVLRLVYSLKQGNVAAEDILNSSTSLAAIPYLMEDVAHGSLEYYGSYRFDDAITGEGRMRELVVTYVASILFSATEFTEETRECLRAIGRGKTDQIQGLSDVSRYLVQWWLLNQDAFEAGKWDEILPLPQEISYPDPRDGAPFLRDERWDPEKQPPYGTPLWELTEPFEAWAERIVDPNRRNLDFVALSWDGKKVVEHPAKSLDPEAIRQQDRRPLKNPTLKNPDVLEPEAETKETLWIGGAVLVIAFFILVLGLLFWLWSERSKTA